MGMPAILRPEPPISPASGGRHPVLLLGSGAREAFHDLLGQLLVSGGRAIVVDGANRFDAYHLARLAQASRLPPGSILSGARVSRATSVPQFLVLLEQKVRAELLRFGARTLFVLGPLDLLTDHDLKEPVVRSASRRAAEALSAVSRDGFAVVCAQDRSHISGSKREYLLAPFEKKCRIVVASRAKPLTALDLDMPQIPAISARWGEGFS